MAEKPFELTISPKKWSHVELPERLYYLEACRSNLRSVARFWVEEEAKLRGHAPDSEEGAESWFLGPIPTARIIRYLINGVKSGGRPRVPSQRLRIDGRSVSRVFPHGLHEGVLFWGVEAHVWSMGAQLQGGNYRAARECRPGPALVLGPSNISSICITDMLSKLFADNRPVVCKIAPRFAPLLPIFTRIFHPLIRDRHVQIVAGDEELGQELLSIEEFETVHLTGKRDTLQRVLQQNKQHSRSLTAQLGCVTPIIITPGTWSQKELNYQARHIASLMVLNGGYSCVTPQILVLAKEWTYKGAFLRVLRTELKKLAQRDDLFPGAAERRASFREDYPEAEEFGPRSLVKISSREPTRLFQEEALCGMLGWVEMDSHQPGRFLKEAGRFCNTSLGGDLSCLLLIDPRTRRTCEHAVAQTLTLLEYGTIGVNINTGLPFVSSVTPWGSYLDGRSDSGMGWTHNTFFFDRPEKTVMEGIFMSSIPKPWVKPFPLLKKLGPAFFKLELEPSPFGMARYLRTLGASIFEKVRR